MKKVAWWFVLVVLVLSSCINKSHTLMHAYLPVGNDGWNADDTLEFTIPQVTKTAVYDFQLGMRLQSGFPYEGIWVVVETVLDNPDVRLCDTLYLKTIRKDGMPIGKGVNLLQSEQPYHKLELYRGQTGKMRLYHIMTREEIPSVSDIGVKVVELSD